MRALRRIVCLAVAVVTGLVVVGCAGGGGMDTVPPPKLGIYDMYDVGGIWNYNIIVPGTDARALTMEAVGRELFGGVDCLRIKQTSGSFISYSLYSAGYTGAYQHALVQEGVTYPFTPPWQFGPPTSLEDWHSTSIFKDVSRTIDGHVVSAAETVTVPFGTFRNAIHTRGTVVIGSYPPDTEDTWWVPGIGIVKQNWNGDDQSMVLTGFTAPH